MNYLRPVSKIKPKTLPSLGSLLTDDDELNENAIANRMQSIREVISQNKGNLVNLIDNLNLCSQNLQLIMVKWKRANQFGKILFDLECKKLVFNGQEGVTLLTSLLDLFSDMIAISPNCIQIIVKHLTTQLYSGDFCCCKDDQISPNESSVFQRVHLFMRDLVVTYPSASRMLTSSIATYFPHQITATSHAYLTYLTNTLTSLDYLPDVYRLLNLIIDKLIWLELSSNNITSNGNDGDVKTDVNLEVKCFNLFDHGFDLFLTKIHSLLHPDGVNYDITRAEEMTDALEDLFFRQVINIEAIVNLPFSLIYWSSFSEEACDRTLDRLWFNTFNTGDKFTPRTIFLLASMLVEANYININHVLAFLENAVAWALEYSDSFSDVMIDETFVPTNHSLFYSVTQSIFYVISCKISEFNEVHLRSLRLLNLQSLIMSKLNPLLFCLPTIVEQFAEISRHHQIALCSLVIDRNKRLTIDTSSFFSHSICYYFPFNNFTFQLSASKFENLLCY